MSDIITKGKRKYYIDKNGKLVYITDINGKKLWMTDDFIDISYFSKNSLSSSLSNAFPYEFNFRCHDVKSIEGVLQALKHEDVNKQQLLFNYYGKDAYNIKCSFDHDWRETGLLYLDGQEIDRFDIAYQYLLNELYVSACCNPLFASALKHTGNREIIYSEGIDDPMETILTSSEYVERLKIIRDTLTMNRNYDARLCTLSDRIVEKYYQQVLLK